MADNRTEKATGRRRQQARERGQVLRSRDLAAALTLLGVIFLLAWQPEAWIGRWQQYFQDLLTSSTTTDWAGNIPVLSITTLAVGKWLVPIFTVAFSIAILATVAQGGVTFATAALTPNFNRLNPVNNLQQLFSLAGLSRVLRTLLPTSLMLYLAIRLLSQEAPLVLHSSRLGPHAALATMGRLWFTMAWQCGLVFLVWAGVDYLLQWQSFERSLRMTKQEVRQENKDNEGSPQVKGRLRRLRRELLRKALNKEVQRATAVVTNPTHYAVAIEYRPATMVAPVVVAKGRNLVARRIKELARWHEVPIVENPPLAQALYKAADVGQMIPPKLYAAVAEILAFLYRAQMRMNARPKTQTAGAR